VGKGFRNEHREAMEGTSLSFCGPEIAANYILRLVRLQIQSKWKWTSMLDPREANKAMRELNARFGNLAKSSTTRQKSTPHNKITILQIRMS
jgi:hypothetical protein